MSDKAAIEAMCDLIRSSEDWLLDRVHALSGGFERLPRTEEAWRDSIRGISDAIFQAAYGLTDGYSGLANRDPVVAYGILRARTHRSRGVQPSDWISLLRRYRQAYHDLIGQHMDPVHQEVCTSFIERVFDRFESGFNDGYVGPPDPHADGAGAVIDA